MSYIALYILLAVLCLWNIRFAPTGMNIEAAMNRVSRLRFIFSILIIFTHCTLPYAELPFILFPLRKISTFGVGYFFISSGYGLAYSAAHKTDYLRTFWKKILYFLWITLFSSVLSVFLQNLVLPEKSALRLINWYMPAIIGSYCIFWAAYRLFPHSKNARNLFLFLAVFVVICSICCVDRLTGQNHRNYYISELAFPFGVLIYEYADPLARFLKKKFSIFVVLAAELVFGGLAFTVPEKGLADLLFHNLMLFPIGLLLIWVMDKFEISNPVLKALNPYTLFIYLFQFPILSILKTYYSSTGRSFDVIYFLGCLGLTCLLAVVLQKLHHSVEKALRGRLPSRN